MHTLTISVSSTTFLGMYSCTSSWAEAANSFLNSVTFLRVSSDNPLCLDDITQRRRLRTYRQGPKKKKKTKIGQTQTFIFTVQIETRRSLHCYANFQLQENPMECRLCSLRTEKKRGQVTGLAHTKQACCLPASSEISQSENKLSRIIDRPDTPNQHSGQRSSGTSQPDNYVWQKV